MRYAALILALTVGISFTVSRAFAAKSKVASFEQSPSYLAWDESEDEPDHGRDITPNPHGKNPHGSDPHGGSPHDEVHDKDMPANNPDKYYDRDERK